MYLFHILADASQPISEIVSLANSFTVRLHPRDADVFIGYPTTEGQITTISQFSGSAFFHTLAKYLKDCFNSCSLDQIYTMVTDDVAEQNYQMRQRNIEYKHVPQKVSTLRQTLYFTNNPQLKVCGYVGIRNLKSRLAGYQKGTLSTS